MLGLVARKFHKASRHEPEAGILHKAISDDSSHTPPHYTALQANGSDAGLDNFSVYVESEEANRTGEHTFTQEHHGVPWLTLRVRSNAVSSKSHPLFFDHATIQGSIELVRTTQTIDFVTVVVLGRLRVENPDMWPGVNNFLHASSNLWHPDVPGHKLQSGTYKWPFALRLPGAVTIQHVGQPKLRAPLPPTYKAPGSIGDIEYLLMVWLQDGVGNYAMEIPINYLPRARPKEASPLRQLAYSEKTALLGPDIDPDGWWAIPSTIAGVFFGKLEVEVDCAVYFAKPLAYSRLTAIPFMIEFASQSTQALDLFAQPSSVTVHLQRAVTVGPTVHEVVGIGRCFPQRDQSTPERGRLEGEIPVAHDLTPSFLFGPFDLKYNVHLTIDAVGFVPLGKTRHAHSHALQLFQEVTVATDRPRGPRQPLVVPHNSETTPSHAYHASQSGVRK